MSETMIFPEKWEPFIDNYAFKDSEKVYTNGTVLVPSFRVEQMVEHYFATDNNDGHKPMTNGDRIRGMTDEELCDLLWEAHNGTWFSPYCQSKRECWEKAPGIPDEWCKKCLLEWLQQPVKEDEA